MPIVIAIVNLDLDSVVDGKIPFAGSDGCD